MTTHGVTFTFRKVLELSYMRVHRSMALIHDELFYGYSQRNKTRILDLMLLLIVVQRLPLDKIML